MLLLVIATDPVPAVDKELLWVMVVPVIAIPELPLVEIAELKVVVPELAFCVTELADVVG